MSKPTYEQLLKQRDELLEACKNMLPTYARTCGTQEAINQLNRIEQAIKSAEAL